MDRWWAGVLLITLALIGGLIVALLDGRRIIGTSVAAPIPGPPLIGDCVIRSENLFVAPLGVSTADRRKAYTPLITGPCPAERSAR